jgi:translocation and assembly module TamB
MSRLTTTLKSGLKWLLIMLAIVLLLVVVLVSAVLVALRSDAGTAWVLEQIPGLETTDARGSLLGEWQAGQLLWQGYGVKLDIASPLIDWSPTCLFRKDFCLDRLEAAALDVTMASTATDQGDSDGGPVALPNIALPLNIDIRSVELGPFHYNGTLVWDSLTLATAGGGSDFHIREFALHREEVAVALDGRVETRGDWPLAINVDLTLPPPYGDRWHVQGDLRGSVRDLRASLSSSGYLDGQLEAELRPLDPSLPASLELNSDAFLALDTLPQTLTLGNWTLTGQGNLANGYRINTRARLPGLQGPVDMSLSGRVTPEAASDLQLSLTGPSAMGDGQAELTAAGDLTWQDGLVAEASVVMEAFPWYSLLPQVEPPPVTIRSLEANGRFAGNEYQASLDMDASGPMGDASLATRVDGDLESVRLTELTMTTGAGKLQGNAEVGFASQLSWQADLMLDSFNPGFWVPRATASINGSVTTRGELGQDGNPDFNASWDLQGQWQDAPLASHGELTAKAGQWQIPEILAAIGDNRLTASGELRDPLSPSGQLSVQGTLALPEPGIIVPGLAGEIDATIALSGPIRLPAGNLELSATGVAWQDQVRIAALELVAGLDESQALEARLEATSLQAGGQTVEQLQADLGGTLDDHRLTVSAQHSAAVVDAVLSGAWLTGDDGGRWQGQLASSEVQLIGPEQTWRLQEPAALNYASQTLTLGSHCWRWQDSTLCAGEQTLFPDTALNLEISQLPASTLAPLLPENVRWDAMINGTLDMALAEAGPRGSVRLSAGPGSVEVAVDEAQQTLDYDTLTASLDLEPEGATVALRLDGPDVGALAVDLVVDPNAANRPTSGTFSLEGFDLAVVGALLEIEDLAGQIAGSGRLEGPLLGPQVYGQLALADGRLVDDRLPIPIQDLALQVNFNGSQADLDGSWKSNGTGTGEIGGSLDWTGEPRLNMTLTGNRLPLFLEPYAELAVSPDLQIEFIEGELSIAGRIAIPSGRIEVRELPEQAVAVSEDEVIVGAEAEEDSPLALAMDVTVVVGEEKVTFEGFGVTGELEGELQIGNQMDTRGALRMVNGRYAAFGQELELRRARLVFVGPVGEPYVDIEAIRRVDDVLAGIRLSGPAREPETTIFSEPAMSQNEALSYLVLGRPLQSQGDQTSVSRMALSLGLKQASGLTRGIGETFGIQDLTLEAQGSGEDAAVVASGYLTEDLSIRYGVGLFEPVTTVALRYDLGRRVYIEAASGLAASLDIFYNRNF